MLSSDGAISTWPSLSTAVSLSGEGRPVTVPMTSAWPSLNSKALKSPSTTMWRAGSFFCMPSISVARNSACFWRLSRTRWPPVAQPFEPGVSASTPLSERWCTTIAVNGKLRPSVKCATASSTSGGRSLSTLVEPFGLTSTASRPCCVTAATSIRTTAPTDAVRTRKPTSIPPTSKPSSRYAT